jgi:hypothetical protein
MRDIKTTYLEDFAFLEGIDPEGGGLFYEGNNVGFDNN